MGPLPPAALPKRDLAGVEIPQSVASKLEVYVYDQGMALAPRGWHCEYSQGDYASGISITPIVNDPSPYGISEGFTAVGGYVESSEIAETWANTYFPTIVKQLYDGHQYDQESYTDTLPKYKTDQIKYVSDLQLEYITPANHIGVASQINGNPFDTSSLTAHGFPISGFITLSTGLIGSDPGVCEIILYSVALPPGLSSLERYILKDAEIRPEAKPTTNCDD